MLDTSLTVKTRPAAALFPALQEQPFQEPKVHPRASKNHRVGLAPNASARGLYGTFASMYGGRTGRLPLILVTFGLIW